MTQIKKKPVARPANHRPAQVRIIGGMWKRSQLSVVSGEGLRPTPDRVRETLFNWLHHLTHGRWESLQCLDLFAGSGALGFEAASRGAAQVLMVENFTPAFQALELSKQKLQAEVITLVRADALLATRNLIKRQQRFDVIFLDPPFNQGFLQKVLPLCLHLLTENGLLYVEAEQRLPMPYSEGEQRETADWCQGWELI
ncbi:MAG: 16S rRNA (guanine(966)-N(2))-methyltransferase RsmD, partial [Undibacterium sp.]|nr:16S rRNA (guanine(966)-N(2))-methyltransferase RsmD [Undibacterium sp.]